MERINHPTSIDLGGGRPGFRSKDTVAGVPGTVVTAVHLNALQEELVALIEKTGQAPSGADLTQILQGVRSQQLNWVDAAGVGGTANALTLTFSPPFMSLASLTGAPLRFNVEQNNTGPVTVAVGGLAPTPLTWPDGTPLVAADLKASSPTAIMFDGTAFRCLVIGSPSNAVAAAIRASGGSPVFPEILTSNARLAITATAGVITIDSGQAWVHRGLIRYSSDLFTAGTGDARPRAFAHVANKVYHLVWDAPGTGLATPLASWPDGRFSLIDRTGASPAESDASYDTTYDRMLVACISTSAGNVATLYLLTNRARLTASVSRDVCTRGTSWTALGAGGHQLNATINWSRTPAIAVSSMDVDAETDTEALNGQYTSGTRYTVTAMAAGYMVNAGTWSPNSFVSGRVRLALSA